MLRSCVYLFVLASFFACKPVPGASGTEQVRGGGAAESADQVSREAPTANVACDCTRLIPIKFRPDFPRVSNPETPGCRYTRADASNRTLVVAIDASTHGDQFATTSAKVQSRFVKIHDSSQSLLEGGGRALVGVASEDTGLTRYAVVDLEASGYVAAVSEALSGPASTAPAPGFPVYLQGLVIGVAGACPPS